MVNETQTNNISEGPVREDPLSSSYHVYGMQQNSDVVFDFLQGERGYFWNKNTQSYEQFANISDNFNELGLKDLYNIMHSVCNRSNVLAELSSTQINKIMERTMITIIKNMTRNKKRWELKEHSRDSILQNSKNQMLMFLSKTLDGHASELFYGNVKMNEDQRHTDNMDIGNGQLNMRG